MSTTTSSIYAPERDVTDVSQCFFYHVMDLPGYGLTGGQWDLRSRVDDYLGHVRFSGKRVLDVGTASGYLCFEMEKRGAQVVGYDLSENDAWDLVPFGGTVEPQRIVWSRSMIRQLNNGWWFARKACRSSARIVYGRVYDMPAEIGPVDISLFGSILLHLRDPFLALQKAAALTSGSMIVTDMDPAVDGPQAARAPDLAFLPDPDSEKPGNGDTWWRFTPGLITRYLKILGFRTFKVTHHKQKHIGDGRVIELPLFTVVATR